MLPVVDMVAAPVSKGIPAQKERKAQSMGRVKGYQCKELNHDVYAATVHDDMLRDNGISTKPLFATKQTLKRKEIVMRKPCPEDDCNRSTFYCGGSRCQESTQL